MIEKIKNYFKSLTPKKVFKIIWNFVLVLLGTFILAYGSAVFLVPFDIITGGLSGLGIILGNVLPVQVDTIVTIFTWGLFILSLIFMGPRFSLNTLVSTIFYPIFFSLVLRTNLSYDIVNLLINDGMEAIFDNGVIAINGIENFETGRLILCGLIGGVFTGLGCGITFIGGGSTGGLDILAFILNKYLGIKTSVATFVLDATIVIVGIILNIVNSNSIGFLASLVGIFSAVACSLIIEFIYVRQSTAYFADIITDKVEEISEFVFNDLDRTVTVYEVVGGYTDEIKKCVRIVFPRNELYKIKDLIARVDEKAFVIYGECATVNGEGFIPIKNKNTDSISKIKALAEEIEEVKEGDKNDGK